MLSSQNLILAGGIVASVFGLYEFFRNSKTTKQLKLIEKNFSLVPDVTCNAYIILNLETGKIELAKNAQKRQQPASLTKLVTFLVINQIIEKQPSVLDQMITVSYEADQLKIGTHAWLKEGERYTVKDMIYAMLLPSGNDAALALAEFFGNNFQPDELYHKVPLNEKAQTDASGNVEEELIVQPNLTNWKPKEYNYKNKWNEDAWSDYDPESAVSKFVAEMNRLVERIGAQNTFFTNCHGMYGKGQCSTVEDMCLISKLLLTNKLFMEVCSCQKYIAQALPKNQKGKIQQKEYWNTNVLLKNKDNQYFGIKTGWIPNYQGQQIFANLSSYVQERHFNNKYIIVTMGSTEKELRFTDTENLLTWVTDQYKLRTKSQKLPK